MRYIVETFRFFRKHPGFSMINLTGLSIGLAVFLLLQLYIQQQEQFDHFWQGHESIYRVGVQWKEGEDIVSYATAPPPLTPHLNSYSGVEAATRLVNWSHFTMRPDNDSSLVFRETNVFIADSQFFSVFQDRLIAGNTDALSVPGSIVLSESALKRYFGDVDPQRMIGRLVLGGKDAGTLWKITGIMKDFPSDSHMQHDIMVSMWDEFTDNDIWTWNVMHTYVRFTNDPMDLSAILSNTVTEKIVPYLLKQQAIRNKSEASSYSFHMTPVGEVHLQNGLRDAMEPGIRHEYLNVLSIVSLLVICLACFNFMNISTALSFSRIRSVGIMKVHGASFRSLFGRFMVEYFFQSILALGFAIGLVELALYLLNGPFSLNLKLSDLFTTPLAWQMGILLVVCTALSGLYPTWHLVRGQATVLLKGERSTGKPHFRNLLIAGQFAISLFLIICTLTLHRQINFLQHIDLGYDRDNILVIQNDREIEERRAEFIASLNELSTITSASFTTGIPTMSRFQTRDVNANGSGINLPLTWYEADENLINTLGLELIKGSNFQVAQKNQALLNESAVKALELTNPVGSNLVINIGAPDEHQVSVKGVVKDFHQRDFRNPTEPLIIEDLDNFIFRDYVLLRYSQGNARKALEDAENTWAKFEPDVPMDYFFFDESFNALFISEQVLNRLFSLFSSLAVIIAMMGLLGVVAITSRQQMREIGIRKVLGASSNEIIWMMLKRFAKIIVLSCVLAIPLSWYASESWLNDFNFRIQLTINLFLLTGILVCLIAGLIIVLQSWSSSRMNPVDVIRKDA